MFSLFAIVEALGVDLHEPFIVVHVGIGHYARTVDIANIGAMWARVDELGGLSTFPVDHRLVAEGLAE